MLRTATNDKRLATRIGLQKNELRHLFNGQRLEDDTRIKALFNFLEGEVHRQRLDNMRKNGL